MGRRREKIEAPVAPPADFRLGHPDRLADRLCVQADGSPAAPTVLAVALTYGVAAYVILPRAVRMGLNILQRKRVPRFTMTGDGLPGDPVNLVLIGTLQQLRAAFAACRLVGGRPFGSGKFVAHGPRLRVQLALSDGAVQHALSFRSRPGHRLPEGDRRQPAQAPSRPLLGLEPRARRSHPRTRRASGSTPTGRRDDEHALWVGAAPKIPAFRSPG